MCLPFYAKIHGNAVTVEKKPGDDCFSTLASLPVCWHTHLLEFYSALRNVYYNGGIIVGTDCPQNVIKRVIVIGRTI